MSKKLYDRSFYETRNADTVRSAEIILDMVQKQGIKLGCVVDVGCGTGTWLKVAKNLGAEKVLGYEGAWVDDSLLEIDSADLVRADFEGGLERTCCEAADLAISLEVAEHLSPSAGEALVKFLTSMSSYVLFSAGVPGQPGVGHVNEQWPSYWVKIFEREGYALSDTIRSQVWWDTRVLRWYRQNTMLFVKENALSGSTAANNYGPVDIVHPEYVSILAPSSASRRLETKLLSHLRKRFQKWFRVNAR